jgi:Chaperone of endosialidase
MKNLISLIFISVLSFSIKAQTTINYSGTGTYDLNGLTTKTALVALSTPAASVPITNHVGIIGIGRNGTFHNYGVIGTTKPTLFTQSFQFTAVFGDNFTNNLNVPLAYVTGGLFSAKNMGGASLITGVRASGTGLNNSSTVYGINAGAENLSNTTANKTIAVSGITTSGTSTVSNYLSGVANPGGYFSSNDGQGIYATTSDGFTLSNFGKVSQAVTGYSNITSAYLNSGVVGYSEGTGNFKAGVIGYIGGTAATAVSYAIYGQDNINASSTYAGYFVGKVFASSSLSVGGSVSGSSATFSGCVIAANVSCPSDSRYKKNILPMENSLSNILKINGVRYDWKVEEFPEKQFSDKNQIGFIAQEIEKIYPEMVLTDDKGFKSVDYARLTPVLVEAIKELTLKNQKLENRLEKIEEILSVSVSKK